MPCPHHTVPMPGCPHCKGSIDDTMEQLRGRRPPGAVPIYAARFSTRRRVDPGGIQIYAAPEPNPFENPFDDRIEKLEAHVDELHKKIYDLIEKNKDLNKVGDFLRKELSENIVDAVGEALGVDTGTCSEDRFKEAAKAVQKVLKGEK